MPGPSLAGSFPSSPSVREDAQLLDPAYQDNDDPQVFGRGNPHTCNCPCSRNNDMYIPRRSLLDRLDSLRHSPNMSFGQPSSPGSDAGEYGRIQLPTDVMNNLGRRASRRKTCQEVSLDSGVPIIWALLRAVQGILGFTAFILMCRYRRVKYRWEGSGRQVVLIIFNLMVVFYAFGTLIYRRVNPKMLRRLLPLVLIGEILSIVLHFFTVLSFWRGGEGRYHSRRTAAWKPIEITNLVLYFFTLFILLHSLARIHFNITVRSDDVNNFFRRTHTFLSTHAEPLVQKLEQRRLRRKKLDQLAQGLLDGSLRIVQVSDFGGAHQMFAHPPPPSSSAGMETPGSASRSVVGADVDGDVETEGRPPAYDDAAGIAEGDEESVLSPAGAPPMRMVAKQAAAEFLLSVERRGDLN